MLGASPWGSVPLGVGGMPPSGVSSDAEGLGFRVCGLQGLNPKTRMKGFRSLVELKGSVFMSRRLWQTVSCYWAIGAATALIVVNFEPVNPKP